MSLTAQFTIDVPLAEARPLFTPEGERLWAEGWNPTYPDADRTEGAGATFVTAADGRETVWVTTDAGQSRLRYARVTPGTDAGLVEVVLEEHAAGTTTVTVTYDLTPLGPPGDARLETFAAQYESFIAHWRHAIEHALSRG